MHAFLFLLPLDYVPEWLESPWACGVNVNLSLKLACSILFMEMSAMEASFCVVIYFVHFPCHTGITMLEGMQVIKFSCTFLPGRATETPLPFLPLPPARSNFNVRKKNFLFQSLYYYSTLTLSSSPSLKISAYFWSKWSRRRWFCCHYFNSQVICLAL